MNKLKQFASSKVATKEETEEMMRRIAEIKNNPKIIGRQVSREHAVYDFPIEMNVTYCGIETTKRLDKGSIVLCRRCGEPIRVNSDSAFEFEGHYYLHCKKCEKDISCLYYFGKELNLGKRK